MVMFQTEQETVTLRARKEASYNAYWGVAFHGIRWLFKKALLT